MISSGQGGEVLTEPLCRTGKQVRRPDVAYIMAELIQQAGEFTQKVSYSLKQKKPKMERANPAQKSLEKLGVHVLSYPQDKETL